MSVVELDVDIASADDVAQWVREIPSTPSISDAPPTTLGSFVDCRIMNQTQFILSPGDSDLLFETYFVIKPREIGPRAHLLAFSAFNRKHTPKRGVDGGTCYRIKLDGKTSMDIALGWAISGSETGYGVVRGGVVESTKPSDGYNAATKSGNSITSKEIFKGRYGSARFRIKVSAAPSGRDEAVDVVVQQEFV